MQSLCCSCRNPDWAVSDKLCEYFCTSVGQLREPFYSTSNVCIHSVERCYCCLDSHGPLALWQRCSKILRHWDWHADTSIYNLAPRCKLRYFKSFKQATCFYCNTFAVDQPTLHFLSCVFFSFLVFFQNFGWGFMVFRRLLHHVNMWLQSIFWRGKIQELTCWTD